MRARRSILTNLAAVVAYLVLVCSVIASQPKHRPLDLSTEHGSVSGKISSIGDASFYVDVRKSQDLVSLQFLIDDSTRISGRLEVGATATVDYRTDGKNNVALNIVVQPPKAD